MPRPNLTRRKLAQDPTDAVGLILLDASGTPIYLSSTARAVISYAARKKKMSNTRITRAILSEVRNNNTRKSVTTIVSGRWTYACREFPLEDARLAPRVADHAIVLERIGQRNRGFPRSLGRFNLTERERKIASLLIAGFTSKELARRMNIRERQVKTYSRSIVAKLGGTA